MQAEQDATRKSELVMVGGPLHSAKTLQTDLGVGLQLASASNHVRSANVQPELVRFNVSSTSLHVSVALEPREQRMNPAHARPVTRRGTQCCPYNAVMRRAF